VELGAVGGKVDANRLLVFLVELPNERTSEHRLGYSTMYVVRWESALSCCPEPGLLKRIEIPQLSIYMYCFICTE
jgi:hypothetical protein